MFGYDVLKRKLEPDEVTIVDVTLVLNVYFYQMDSTTFSWSLRFLAHLGTSYLRNIQTSFMQR